MPSPSSTSANHNLSFKRKNFNVSDQMQAMEIKDFSKISSWAREAVVRTYRLNLLKGKSDGKFDPKGFVTRAEMATVIKRLAILLEIR